MCDGKLMIKEGNQSLPLCRVEKKSFEKSNQVGDKESLRFWILMNDFKRTSS